MIYNFLLTVIYILLIPILAVFALKKKYRHSIPARFFLYKNHKFNNCDVIFHCCSYGEVNAIKNITKAFSNFGISVITQTGFDLAKNITPNVRFLPFEIFLPYWLTKTKVLVIFEAELWLNLVKFAKKNGTFVILLNARISDRSYKRYKMFKFYYQMVFKNIDLIYAQSTKDATRLKELGAKNIKVIGNIKSNACNLVNKEYKKFDNKLFIIIASTHEGEEEMILDNLEFKENYKILLAPRHPERFDKAGEILEKFAKKNNLSYEKFSNNLGLNSDVILLDTLGELVNFYLICDVCILCGSFVDNVGGHNPIEIAQFNKPIISGRYFFNQETLYKSVENIDIIDIKDINNSLKNPKKTYIKDNLEIYEVINSIKDKL